MSHKSLFQTKNISRMLVGSLIPFYSFLWVAMPAHAEEQMYNFTVTNDTEETITELYVDDAEEEEWSVNIADEPIAPGETVSFEWADEDVEEGDPCMYHVRAVFEDDSVAEEIEDGLDFCENPEVVVSSST